MPMVEEKKLQWNAQISPYFGPHDLSTANLIWTDQCLVEFIHAGLPFELFIFDDQLLDCPPKKIVPNESCWRSPLDLTLGTRVYTFAGMQIFEYTKKNLMDLDLRLRQGDRSAVSDPYFDYVRVPPHPFVLATFAQRRVSTMDLVDAKISAAEPTVPYAISSVWFKMMLVGAESCGHDLAEIRTRLAMDYVDRFWRKTEKRLPLRVNVAGTIFSKAFREGWIPYDFFIDEIELGLQQLIFCKNWRPKKIPGNLFGLRGKKRRYDANVHVMHVPGRTPLAAKKLYAWHFACRCRQIAFKISRDQISKLDQRPPNEYEYLSRDPGLDQT